MPPDAELERLISADVIRDGGSIEAVFETADGRLYNIYLQRSKMPDAEGLHHRWLFEYFGSESPDNPLPIVTGSEEERALISRLSHFAKQQLVDPAAHPKGSPLWWLQRLIDYIEHREPCFPADLSNQRFYIPPR